MLDAAFQYSGVYLTGQILYLILYVTSRCNSRCKMCFSWRGMEERRKCSPALSLEEIDKITQHSPAVGQLTLSGGEPFLRDDLPEICQLFYKNTHTRFFTIPTNCLLPEKFEVIVSSFYKRCHNGYLNFCLPIDGVGTLHDEIRGVKGNFEKLIESIKVIQQMQHVHKRLTFNLNTVLSKYNKNAIREIIDYAISNYPDIPYGFALVRGDTRLEDAKVLPESAYNEACEYYRSKYRHNPIRKAPYSMVQKGIVRMVQDKVSKSITNASGVFRCRAGDRMLVIYENGDVSPCEILGNRLYNNANVTSATLGNLRDSSYNLKGILKSGKAKLVLEHIRNTGCSCTWECAIFNSLISNPISLTKIIAKGVLSKTGHR